MRPTHGAGVEELKNNLFSVPLYSVGKVMIANSVHTRTTCRCNRHKKKWAVWLWIEVEYGGGGGGG